MAPTATDYSNGFWGKPTSTLDWCETNYELSPYIAEFYNTVSNVAMIVPPLYGFYLSCIHQFEIRYKICYLLLCLVGIGSWCFHMTLLYQMQLFDEIPMVLGSLYLIYILANLYKPHMSKSPLLALCLVLYGITFTAIYLQFKYPLIHQVGYGFLVSIVLYLDICVAIYVPCEVRLFYWSAVLYYVGFVVWNIDNIFCPQLQQLRSLLPVALAPFTQLHAWWHLMAGYGSYIHILYCIHAQELQDNRRACVTFNWSGFNIIIEKQKKMRD